VRRGFCQRGALLTGGKFRASAMKADKRTNNPYNFRPPGGAGRGPRAGNLPVTSDKKGALPIPRRRKR